MRGNSFTAAPAGGSIGVASLDERHDGRSGYLPYFPALDGVRAVAVLAVVWYHATAVTVGDPLGAGGFLGVSTFFTLSGFLLTSLLLSEWRLTSSVDLGAFWARRLRRLAPAALLVVAVVVVATRLRIGRWGDGLRFADAGSAATNLMNWHLRAAPDDLARSIGPLSPYWSLAIEEQFYVFLTVLFLVVRRRTWGRPVLVGVFGALWLSVPLFGLAVHPIAPRELYAPYTRGSELAAGALLALAVDRWGFPVGQWRRVARVAGWIGLVGTVAAYLFIRADQRWVYTVALAVVSIASVAVVAGCLVDGGVTRILSRRPLVWLGQLSYSLYLVHWPTIRILTADRVHLHGWALVPVVIGASLVLATVLSLLVEQPIRKRWRASPPVVAGAWVGATLAVCLLALVLV